MSSVCKLAMAASLAGLLAGAPASANETGFELGISGLSTRLDDVFSGSRSADLTRVNDRTEGWALSGAWRFNPQFALDLEYADHGNFRGFNVCPPDLACIAANIPERVEARTWTVSVLGELPIANNWGLFGRLGWAETLLDRQFAGNVRDDGLAAGAGVRWAYREDSSLSLEYRDEAADLERVGVTLSYRF